jgi:hypothetical protein
MYQMSNIFLLECCVLSCNTEKGSKADIKGKKFDRINFVTGLIPLWGGAPPPPPLVQHNCTTHFCKHFHTAHNIKRYPFLLPNSNFPSHFSNIILLKLSKYML